jgi:hypothetical protein
MITLGDHIYPFTRHIINTVAPLFHTDAQSQWVCSFLHPAKRMSCCDRERKLQRLPKQYPKRNHVKTYACVYIFPLRMSELLILYLAFELSTRGNTAASTWKFCRRLMPAAHGVVKDRAALLFCAKQNISPTYICQKCPQVLRDTSHSGC